MRRARVRFGSINSPACLLADGRLAFAGLEPEPLRRVGQVAASRPRSYASGAFFAFATESCRRRAIFVRDLYGSGCNATWYGELG